MSGAPAERSKPTLVAGAPNSDLGVPGCGGHWDALSRSPSEGRLATELWAACQLTCQLFGVYSETELGRGLRPAVSVPQRTTWEGLCHTLASPSAPNFLPKPHPEPASTEHTLQPWRVPRWPIVSSFPAGSPGASSNYGPRQRCASARSHPFPTQWW